MLKLTIPLLLLISSLNAQRPHAIVKPSDFDLPDAPGFHALNLSQVHALPLPTISAPAESRVQDLMVTEGTRIKLTLLDRVSSKQPSGTKFEAQLGKAVNLNGAAPLPAGTTFQGHIQSTHAQRMMRRGSVYLVFDQLTLPTGERHPIHAYLASVDPERVQLDSEGRVRPRWSRKRLAIEIGGTALVGKLADDLAESAAAGTIGAASARYVGLGASATFLLLQKGPDAQLRPGATIEVEIGRIDATPISYLPLSFR